MPVESERLEADALDPVPIYDFDWIFQALDQHIGVIRAIIEPTFAMLHESLDVVFTDINGDDRLLALNVFHSQQLTRWFYRFYIQIGTYFSYIVMADKAGLLRDSRYSKRVAEHKINFGHILARCANFADIAFSPESSQPRDVLAEFETFIGMIQDVYDNKINKAFPALGNMISEITNIPVEQDNIIKRTIQKWGQRDKKKYRGSRAAFQFIVDHYPTLRTTGALNEIDHALYVAYGRAMEKRDALATAGKELPPFPEGFKPLMDKGTEIATRPLPSAEDARQAQNLVNRFRRDRERKAGPER